MSAEPVRRQVLNILVQVQAGQSRGARNVSKLLTDAHASGIVGVG